MKCWQCGYDLRLHDGPKCPECGAEKGFIVLRPNKVLLFGWAVVVALFLLFYGSVAGGTSNGSMLPFALFFAPVAFFGFGSGFLFGMPLYLAYASALSSTRSRRRRQWVVRAIFVAHYCAFALVLTIKPGYLEPSNWVTGTMRVVGDPDFGYTGPAVFVVTQLALVLWALRRERVEFVPPAACDSEIAPLRL